MRYSGNRPIFLPSLEMKYMSRVRIWVSASGGKYADHEMESQYYRSSKEILNELNEWTWLLEDEDLRNVRWRPDFLTDVNRVYWDRAPQGGELRVYWDVESRGWYGHRDLLGWEGDMQGRVSYSADMIGILGTPVFLQQMTVLTERTWSVATPCSHKHVYGSRDYRNTSSSIVPRPEERLNLTIITKSTKQRQAFEYTIMGIGDFLGICRGEKLAHYADVLDDEPAGIYMLTGERVVIGCERLDDDSGHPDFCRAKLELVKV